jgi:hypothetical protein
MFSQLSVGFGEFNALASFNSASECSDLHGWQRVLTAAQIPVDVNVIIDDPDEFSIRIPDCAVVVTM